MKNKVTVLIPAAAAFAVAALAAAGASSASGAAYSAGGYGDPGTVSSASRVAAATVGVGHSSLGRVIVDSKGRTLYLFEKDTSRRSACSGQCAQYWPPLLTRGAPVARAGVKRSLLGRIRRANGSQQVTYAGHPLYRYVGDSEAGQTNGEGSEAFGAGWDALTPSGKKIERDG